MTEGIDFRSFDRELDSFSRRVSALRVARECSPETALPTLDAALVELELAEEELRVCREEIASHGDELAQRHGGGDRERQVLRAVFQELPVPVFLLDHGGAIRRANRMAAGMLASSPAFVTGKPFPVFVDLPARAVFRSRLSAVLRGTGEASFDSRLLRGGGAEDVRLVLARVEVPGEAHPLVSVVVTTPVAVDGRHRDLGVLDAAVEEQMIVAAARRLDVMARMTRLLLDEESLHEAVALHRAARLLAGEFAEWVAIDVVRDGTVYRAVVAGPEDRDGMAGTQLLEQLDPGLGDVPREVLETGGSSLRPLIEDDQALGITPEGLPVLAALHAGSLLSVPLRDEEHEILGALTLIRHSDRARFELSDLGLLEEIGEHLALAIRTERRYQRRSDAADALQASLLPRSLPAVPGLDIAASYRAATDGVEVGGDFYDVYQSPGGHGLVLGDVCGKGEEAATVTAMVRHGVRLLGLWNPEPGEVLRLVNHAMFVQQETDRFVTAVAAHLSFDDDDVLVRLASAGHPRAAILRAEGSVHFASGGGLPLGIFEDAEAEPERFRLTPGDTLLLYSDGVTETRGVDGTLYGDEGLADALARTLGLPASAVVKAVEDDLQDYSGGRVRDDVALLAVRVNDPVV